MRCRLTFNVFVNKFIVDMRLTELGCHVNRVWVGCVMYADDILLLSASVGGLQVLLDKCTEISGILRLKFNCAKSVCFVIEPRRSVLPDMILGQNKIAWNTCVKYLGISFVCGVKLKCEVDMITRKFYAASNSIFSNTRGLAELLQLNMQQIYCLPILQYASIALRFTKSQLNTLNACGNIVYRKICGFHQWESVTQFIAGIGNLDFSFTRYLLCLKFFNLLRRSVNVVIRCTALIFFHSNEFCNMLKILTYQLVSLCMKLRLIYMTVFFHGMAFVDSPVVYGCLFHCI